MRLAVSVMPSAFQLVPMSTDIFPRLEFCPCLDIVFSLSPSLVPISACVHPS